MPLSDPQQSCLTEESGVKGQPFSQSISMLRRRMYKASLPKDSRRQRVQKPFNLATALPSADSFRTSLLLPKMSAQFPLLQDPGGAGLEFGPSREYGMRRSRQIRCFNPSLQEEFTSRSEETSLNIPVQASIRRSARSVKNCTKSTLANDRSVRINAPSAIPLEYQPSSVRYSSPSRPVSNKSFIWNDPSNLYSSKLIRNCQTVAGSDASSRVMENCRKTKASKLSGSTNSFDRQPELTKPMALSTRAPLTESPNRGNRQIAATGGNLNAGGSRDRKQVERFPCNQSNLSSCRNSDSWKLEPYPAGYSETPVLSTVACCMISASEQRRLIRRQDRKNHHPSARLFAVSDEEKGCPLKEFHSIWVAALEAKDVGKATAMGVFNQPASSYNEEEFIRRQLHLHQDRVTRDTSAEHQKHITSDKGSSCTYSDSSQNSSRHYRKPDTNFKSLEADTSVWKFGNGLALDASVESMHNDGSRSRDNNEATDAIQPWCSHEMTTEGFKAVLPDVLVGSVKRCRTCHHANIDLTSSKRQPFTENGLNMKVAPILSTSPQGILVAPSKSTSDSSRARDETQGRSLYELVHRHLRDPSE